MTRADLARLRRWMSRARPPRRALARAVTAGLLATCLNVALLVGAVGLLVASAARPGLEAVLGALIVIELLAFFRSPLRYVERLSAHQLGYGAVTTWRRWLVSSVGRQDYATWRTYAAGDLLERSLRDTEELQDLWLRFVIPLASSLVTLALVDVTFLVMSPQLRWWPVALVAAVLQVGGVAALVANTSPLLRSDRELRRTRGAFRAELVELSTVAPELVLLGRGSYVTRRADATIDDLRRRESATARLARRGTAVPAGVAVLGVAALSAHPTTSPTWMAVSAMLVVATVGLLTTVRLSLETSVSVLAGAERLEQLDRLNDEGTSAWPADTTVEIAHVRVSEDDKTMITDATLSIAPGRRVALTGASGSGKSTLLRVIAALDAAESGSVRIGDVEARDIDEGRLRSHLGYVPAEPGLTRGFAQDVLTLGRTPRRDAIADLAAVGLLVEPTTRFEALSRGERARVALVRALVIQPDIVLLDEPTAGLGREESARVLDLVAASGATVLVATHDPTVIEWCDEVVELRDGVVQHVRR